MKKLFFIAYALIGFSVYAQTFDEAYNNWLEIKHEKTRDANTATRVGSAGISIIKFVNDTLDSYCNSDAVATIVAKEMTKIKSEIRNSEIRILEEKHKNRNVVIYIGVIFLILYCAFNIIKIKKK